MTIETNTIPPFPETFRGKPDLGNSGTTFLSKDVKDKITLFQDAINKREPGKGNTQTHARSDNSLLEEYVSSQMELSKLGRQFAEKGINEGALINTKDSNIVQKGILDDIDIPGITELGGEFFDVAKDIFEGIKAIKEGDLETGIDILNNLVNKSGLPDKVKELVSIVAEAVKDIPKIIEDVDNKNYAAAAEKSANLGKDIVKSINDFFSDEFVFGGDAIGEEFSELAHIDDLEGFLENAEIVAGKVDGIMKNIELGTQESFLKATEESAELASFLTDDYPIVSDLFETISEIPDKMVEIREKIDAGEMDEAIAIAQAFAKEVREEGNPLLAGGFDKIAAGLLAGTLALGSGPVDGGGEPEAPSALVFDAEYYLLQNPDLKAAFGNDHEAAQKHFLEQGIQEGRRGSAVFDAKYYLSQNPDLRAAFGDNNYEAAHNHWLEYGVDEGRSGALEFDAKYYLSQNPDLRAAFGDNNYEEALNHWLQNGINEGRVGQNPLVQGFVQDATLYHIDSPEELFKRLTDLTQIDVFSNIPEEHGIDKQRLIAGFEAALSIAINPTTATAIQKADANYSLDALKLAEFNPETGVDNSQLDELADSIKEKISL